MKYLKTIYLDVVNINQLVQYYNKKYDKNGTRR